MTNQKHLSNSELYFPCDLEFSVEENPFESLAVDLTYRCNMKCNFCYNPERSWADMKLSYFEKVCQRLPRPVAFRFLGGEPVLHPDFFGFLKTAVRYGHTNFLNTNGLAFTDPAFLQSFAENKVPVSIGITLDGGISRNDVYEYISGQDCMEMKLQAFNNLVEYKFGRICISAIIVRGYNEEVIPELLALADANSEIVRYIHFRSAGKVGRWQDTEPYTLQELKNVVGQHFSEKQFQASCISEIHCKPSEDRGCCYRFRPSSRLQISLIEFATDLSAGCLKRGKLIDRRFVVQSFFEQMMKNSSRLLEEKRQGT